MHQCYVPKRFSPDVLRTIEQANRIIDDYANEGYTLTLRQLYYQFVARDLIPNTMQSYKRLGSIINDARLAGEIDWDAIEDRTRFLRTHSNWESPASIVRVCADQFEIDMWENQDIRPEVWIEKDALVGVVERVCDELRIPYFACRGYASQSELRTAGLRLRRHIRNGQRPVILHLGDHDPSGMDMTRDNRERLEMFAESNDFDLVRLALNFDQIEQYNPPPNPAKLTDSRAEGYIAEFGHSSWELDALSPEVINRLIKDEVQSRFDADAWAESEAENLAGQSRLRDAARRLEEEDDDAA